MAYLQSVVSAGIMFHVTRACESGDVFDCGCDTRFPQTNPSGDWSWGGCSDNIRYGMYFTRQFVDASKDGDRAFDAMTKHNYEAGRQVLYPFTFIIILKFVLFMMPSKRKNYSPTHVSLNFAHST